MTKSVKRRIVQNTMFKRPLNHPHLLHKKPTVLLQTQLWTAVDCLLFIFIKENVGPLYNILHDRWWIIKNKKLIRWGFRSDKHGKILQKEGLLVCFSLGRYCHPDCSMGNDYMMISIKLWLRFVKRRTQRQINNTIQNPCEVCSYLIV